MFGAVGAPIDRLVRVRIGPVRIDGLRVGSRSAAQGPGGSRPGFGRWIVSFPPQSRRPNEPRDLVVALDGPGSSGKSSVGAAAALACGYRFCDTGLLYRAVTWLALARDLSASYPHAIRGLVDEVELGAGRTAAGWPGSWSTARTTPTTSAAPAGGCRRLGDLGHPGTASRPAGSAARPRGGRRHRDGRSGHRDRGAARRGPQALPGCVGRGARPAPRRGAWPGSGERRGPRDPRRPPPS